MEINDQELYPFDWTELPEIFEKKAEVELQDSPEKRTQSLNILKDMIKNDKFFKDTYFNDDFLCMYLKVKKYNVSKTFSQLRAYLSLRKKNPQMFSNFQFDKISITTTNKVVTVLPWRCHEGCAIILIQLDNWNPELFPIEEVWRMSVHLLAQCGRYPMTQINGIKIIYDVKSNPTLSHIKHATPRNLYLIAHGTQNCSPASYREVHIVNDSLTLRVAWLFLKIFLSDKMKKRIMFHSSPDELLNHFPRKCLPVQYGGTLEKFDMTYWLRDMMQPIEIDLMFGGRIPEGYKFVRKYHPDHSNVN